MSPRTAGRIIGACFLIASVVYLTGEALISAGSGTPAVLAEVVANERQIAIGALLMLANSAVVVTNAVVAFPILRLEHERSAYAYLAARVIEAVMLTVGILLLLLVIPIAAEHVDAGAGEASALTALARVAQEGNQYAYQIGILSVVAAGLTLCRFLFRTRLVPRPMAVWGLVGYAILAVGIILEIVGYGVGLALAIPGGLFEIALGILLVVRGFPARSSTR